MARGRKKRTHLFMNFGDGSGVYKKKKYFKRFKRRKRRGGY